MKIDKRTLRKGKTYEEIFGVETALLVKKVQSENNKKTLRKGKTYEEIYGLERAQEHKKRLSDAHLKLYSSEGYINPLRGKTYEEIYGVAGAQEQKKKIWGSNRLWKLNSSNWEKEHIPWNKGLTKETDERVAKYGASGSKTKTGRKLKDVLGIDKFNDFRNKISKLHTGKKTSNGTKVKQSQAKIKSIQRGEYHFSKRGYFFSKKNNKSLYYMSSFELLAFQILESMINVTYYKAQFVKIPYIYDNKKHNYIVDLYVEYTDGQKQIIEIKPKYDINTPVNQAKFSAAKRFAEENDMKWDIWTEDVLF